MCLYIFAFLMDVSVHQDHENAETLANGISALPGLHVTRYQDSTNAVYIKVSTVGIMGWDEKANGHGGDLLR